MITLHNSMSRASETFVPGDSRRISMYVCGPTVYDTPHLGNARPAVAFDVLFRLLRHIYGDGAVVYARNLTDIDDKIMDRAASNGESIDALTERTIAEYHSIVSALGCLPPTHEPRATANIDPIKGQIAALILNGYAYVAEGHVLFSVDAHPEHGKLTGHDQADLQTGQHRVEVASYKRNPADFVLWKPSTEDQPGWDSPWSRGRPGWHIECSAMIENLFADQTIDIHAGGGDLRFPHHDCEISQYACSHHEPGRVLARYWLHNGMLITGGEKMAKSAGNFFTVRDVMAQGYTGQEIRLALLQTHYRAPLDWKPPSNLELAREALRSWQGALHRFRDVAPAPNQHVVPVIAALCSDLNTPLAIAELHALSKAANSDSEEHAAALAYALGLLGLSERVEALDAESKAILAERSEARLRGDYALSDTLRARLKDRGILVKDEKGGTVWWRS
jgi:cysteinyl-tRNA synthetase